MWIAGPLGKVDLTIPLRLGRNQKTLMKDVLIDDRGKWWDNHWKTLTASYNRSPWFEYYRPELWELYSNPPDRLVDWNDACFKWATEKLGFKLAVSVTDRWIAKYEGTEFLDWRNKLLPNSINQPLSSTSDYPQVFIDRTGFIPNLSVLDLLFCEGRNAGRILDKQ